MGTGIIKVSMQLGLHILDYPMASLSTQNTKLFCLMFPQELKSLTGMLFQFGGVELFAVYISMLPNGIADYTFAVKMAALIVFILYLVGTLVITLSSSPSTLAAHATLLEVLPAMGLEEIAAPMALFVGIGGCTSFPIPD